ncbi:MAG TPA: glycerophosphodiester phosphodiesterase [Oscillatoriaceae cyanobacterium M33_DOE_052]|uniref:Glycerophosphodiester phosphodiesterase n=1 Tax=Planktothricoides sp. SpSt-374 TaxID=2282167 RepID=A0A7C3VFL7_9CYAN|nr:glycerophosphodiester phosphodiesterase [Oscillatoriaceae cyanobacterium M33_DOE_052]
MELEIIAHRGFSAAAPENTLAAFAAAIEHGADAIELDVQLTADGIPVVIHDSKLKRTTGTKGKVFKKNLSDLKQLDAGAWFHPQFSGQQIPTLAEALHSASGIPKHIYLDVKTNGDWPDIAIANLLDTILTRHTEAKCVIASFNHQFVAQVRQQDSGQKVTIGYLVATRSAYKSQLPKAAAAGNAVMMSEYRVLLKYPSLVAASHNLGVDVVAWTVDKPKHFQRLLAIGVNRIITNTLLPPSAQ